MLWVQGAALDIRTVQTEAIPTAEGSGRGNPCGCPRLGRYKACPYRMGPGDNTCAYLRDGDGTVLGTPPLVRCLELLPRLVRIELRHGRRRRSGFGPKVLLIDHPVVVHDEGHDPGRPVLRWVGY